ncbi:MAG: HTH domain-containing protein [bacterium]
MAERLNVLELQEELWKIAEREARKQPSIAKRALKKKLREEILSSELLERFLPEKVLNTIEKSIDIAAEMAITFARLMIDSGEPPKRRGRRRGRKPGRKKKRAAGKKPGRKKKPAKKRKKKRGKPIADAAAEILKEKKGGPMKVTEIRDAIKERKLLKSRAKDLYTVILVTMSKSPAFEKVGPGEYKLAKPKRARKRTPAAPQTTSA